MSLRQRIPDPEVLLSLAPEELASQLLNALGPIRQDINQGMFNRDQISRFAAEYQRRQDEVEIAITEAWRWLEINMFILPAPGINGHNGWFVHGRRGRAALEELFFLASVLHDLGLTTEFRGTERFEVVGADAAAAFLRDQGVNDERRAIIWDAIALHTSVGIASRKRPEIALVHIGAGIDVLGLELNKLPPTLVAQTIEALPRHDFNKAFFSVLVDTIAHAPQSAAMTWMCETANEHVPGCYCPSFTSQLQASPFKE